MEAQELEINHLHADNVPWKYGMVWPVEDVTPILLMPRHVVNVIARRGHMTVEALYGRRKDRKAAYFRQMAMLVMRETQPNMSIAAIGRHFGRDHTTILHGIKAVRTRIKNSGVTRKLYRQICEDLGVKPRATI